MSALNAWSCCIRFSNRILATGFERPVLLGRIAILRSLGLKADGPEFSDTLSVELRRCSLFLRWILFLSNRDGDDWNVKI